MGGLARIRDVYVFAAVTWLSTTILLVGVTVFGYFLFRIVDAQRNSRPVTPALRANAVHGGSSAEAALVFAEFDRMGENESYIYQPWTGFSERVYHSAKLNVDENLPVPARRTIAPHRQGHSKRERVVWMFGGSTLFGWRIADGQTIPSHVAGILAEKLPDTRIKVVNHGHSSYYSSQEVLLFLTMLRQGQTCDAAVFLDGLNEAWNSEDRPAFSDRVAAAFLREQQANPSSRPYLKIFPEFPPLRLASAVADRFLPSRQKQAAPEPRKTYDPIHTYQFNIQMAAATAALNNVRALFLWQPTPFDYFDPKLRRAEVADLNARARSLIRQPNFHFMADFFQGENYDEVYVDGIHYGDRSCRRLADAICSRLLDGGLL